MKPLTPTSIKFTPEQKTFLKRMARDQKHRKLSTVVKQLVDAARTAPVFLSSGTSSDASTKRPQ